MADASKPGAQHDSERTQRMMARERKTADERTDGILEQLVTAVLENTRLLGRMAERTESHAQLLQALVDRSTSRDALSNDKIISRIQTYRSELHRRITAIWDSKTWSSLSKDNMMIVREAMIIHRLKREDPLHLDKVHTFASLTSGTTVPEISQDVEQMLNVMRGGLEVLANKYHDNYMTRNGQTFMVRLGDDGENDTLERVSVIDWWKARVRECMVVSYATAVENYDTNGKTFVDILRIFHELAAILEATNDHHRIVAARDQLVKKLRAHFFIHSGDHNVVLKMIDEKMDDGEEKIKPAVNGKSYLRVARSTRSEPSPPNFQVRTDLVVDSGAFSTMAGCEENFVPGTLKPLGAQDEFFETPVEGPFEGTEQMQVKGRGTVFTYVQIDDGDALVPRYKYVTVKDALYVPRAKEILLNPDDLMNVKLSGGKWEIVWTEHVKLLAYDGYPIMRQTPDSPSDRSWVFKSRQTPPPRDQVVNLHRKSVLTKSIRGEHQHRIFHAPQAVLAQLPNTTSELPKGWDKTAVYHGDCPACAGSHLVAKKGGSNAKIREEATAAPSTSSEVPSVQTSQKSRHVLPITPPGGSTKQQGTTSSSTQITRRMSKSNMRQAMAGGTGAKQEKKVTFRTRRDGTAVDDANRSMVDIHGPRAGALTGEKLAVLVVDEESRFMTARGLKNKKQFYEQFFRIMSDKRRRRPSIVRGDDDSLYTQDFVDTLAEFDVHFEKTAPYTHNQIGLPERCFRTIGEKMDAMLVDANLPTDDFWVYAFMYSISVLNVLPRTDLDGRSPFEVYYGRKPNVSQYRIFGCYIMVFVSKEIRQKGDMRHKEGIFLGFSSDSTGIVFYDLHTRKVSTCSFEQYTVVDDRSNFVPRKYADKGPVTRVDTKSVPENPAPVMKGPNPELTRDLFHWKTRKGASAEKTPETGPSDQGPSSLSSPTATPGNGLSGVKKKEVTTPSAAAKGDVGRPIENRSCTGGPETTGDSEVRAACRRGGGCWHDGSRRRCREHAGHQLREERTG